MPPVQPIASSSSAGVTDRVSRGRLLAWYVVPSLVVLVFVFWPLVTGGQTLFFRDVLNTHLEMKWWQAEAMKEGFLPLIDPYRSGGQPHLGNPNTVALYPDNLLYRVSPLFWALNAHFWLHLLLAPVGAYWLGRRLGLEPRAAWAAGVFYGASGYLLSTLNLYNLVAGAALVPAFLASILEVYSGRNRRWAVPAAAGLWCLLILAGDPMTAALALAMGLSMLWLESPGRKALGLLAAALAAGTLVAAPQWVEFLRILELSFRGHRGYSEAAATVASWHPGAALEWFLPLAFGGPDLTFWGQRFYSNSQPLFYSFYPGLFSLACLGLGLVSRHGSRRVLLWAGALMAGGLFLALGGYNPLVSWLLGLPGLSVLRLPVKFWPMVAVPAAMVAGIGFESCVRTGGATRFRRVALLFLGGYLIAWLLLAWGGTWIESILAGWMPEGFGTSSLPEIETERWRTLLLWHAGLALVFLLATLARERVFRLLLPALLVAHLVLQLTFLAPLYRSEETGIYESVPPAATAVPEQAVAAHAAVGGLFGTVPMPVDKYPSPDPRWMQRQLHYEANPYVGMMQRRRFEFVLSPEGLDSFLTRAATEAFPLLTDENRVRLLEASGVEWLYMKRELEGTDSAELVERYPSVGGDLLLYRLPGAAAPVQFVGEILPSANLNEALVAVTSPDFRPRSQVVVAGSSLPGSELAGAAIREMPAAGPESWSWTVAAEGAGVLLIQRSHLPIYRLEVDGVEVEPLVGNLHRLAVPLEAGRHVVRLRVDRRPFRVSLVVAVLTALALVLYVVRPAVQRRTTVS
ncbi:MAG: hypothetical protein ACE5GX_07195 [Thermoanaerobaculia bacterium]